jgi:mannose-6-phosphate isomerase-like protein (cupin superfamily)
VEPSLVLPGGGDTVVDESERSIAITAGHELVAVVEMRYAAGQHGPAPHVHREHADSFWVLDGELTFTLGDEDLRGPAGTFVLVPAGVVHTFRNEGPGDARFLNFHAPSKGFDQYLRRLRRSKDAEREAQERFDQFEPPADGGRPASEALVRRPGEGEMLAAGPSSISFKAGGDEGGGRLSLTETTVAPGFPGPVPHRHLHMVDSFYVLEGTLTVRLEERTVEAGAGTYAFVPPGAVHTFSNPGSEPVRMLNLMAPGGFEQYLKEVVAATPPGALPDPAAMASIASKYDFEPI